jgi:adenosylhomocysteine nucleosidase
MMLRYLVNNWVRQAARQKLMETVGQAAAGIRQREQPSSEGVPPQPPPRCRVLVAFALEVEAGGLLDLLEHCVTSQCSSFVEHVGTLGGQRIAVLETGVGREAAARATADAVALHRPAWLVSAGFAASLDHTLHRRHVLMADHLCDTHGAQMDLGLKLDAKTLAANPHVHSGRLLTVDHLVRTLAEKEHLADRYGAVACDMESMAVAEVCSKEKVRFLSVRIISDAVEDELPKEIESLLNQHSLAARLGAATGALFRRPSSIKDMWKLKEDAIKAADTLARFLKGTLAQLDAGIDAGIQH